MNSTPDDSAKIVQQALDLLMKNNVGKCLEYLLNTYDLSCDAVVVSNSSVVADQQKSEFEIEDVQKQLRICYDDKEIQIILCNRFSGSFPDGESYDSCTLFIFYRNICVLHDKMNNESTVYGSEWQKRYFSRITLKSFTNGGWVTDLATVVARFQDARKQRDEQKKLSEISSVASKINLNSID